MRFTLWGIRIAFIFVLVKIHLLMFELLIVDPNRPESRFYYQM